MLITAPRLLLFALFMLLMLINPVISENFDDIYLKPRMWWIYAVVLPAALVCLWQRRAELRALLQSRITRSFLLLATLIALAMLSHPSPNTWWGPADRADGVAMHLVYIVVALAGLLLARDPRTAPELGLAALIGGGGLALSAIGQQLGLLGVIGEGAFAGVEPTLYGGLIGNRGYLGGAMSLLLPVALWAVMQRPRQHWRTVCTVLATLMVWAWAASMARGAWLAGSAALLWLAYWWRPAWRTWIPLVLGLGCCALAFALTSSQEDLNKRLNKGHTSGRDVLWTAAVRQIKESPLLGTAPPALLKQLNAMTDQELMNPREWTEVLSFHRLKTKANEPPAFALKFKDGHSDVLTFAINKTHNEYLDYALNYGVPAAIIFMGLLFLGIWFPRTAAPFLSAGLLGYALYILTWPELIRFAPIAWFMLGVAHGMSRALDGAVPEPPASGAAAPR